MPRSQIASDAFAYSDGDLQTVSGGAWTQLNPSAATLDVTGGAITCAYAGLGACRWTGAGGSGLGRAPPPRCGYAFEEVRRNRRVMGL